MNATRLRADILPLALLATACFCSFSFWRLHSANSAAIKVRSILGECKTIAGQICALKQGPTRAQEHRSAEDELARRIESWCRSSKIRQADLVSIEPLAPTRKAASSYVQQGARVQLRSVTLPQLAAFESQMHNSAIELTLGDLRLTAPRSATGDAEAAEAWQGAFVLTYYVYAPKSSR